MSNIVRAVFPMLIVLRLADQKEPVMDKLFFYVRRMDLTLERLKGILDEMEKRTRGTSWRLLNDIRNNFDDPLAVTDFIDDDEELDESTDSDSLNDDTTKTLGQKVSEIWLKRRDRLVSDFAIAGWLLSPIPEVYRDSSSNQTGEH